MATQSNSPGHEDLDVSIHTRLGFVGDVCTTLRPSTVHEYTSVSGPHAPHRIDLFALSPADRDDPSVPPTALLSGRTGLTLCVSGLSAPTPYVWKNTEFDELHFVQEGELEYVTAFGTLRAEPGDFVYIGRSVAYRLNPISSTTLRLIVEVPDRLRLSTSQPFGIVNAAHDVVHPDVTKSSSSKGGELWLKSFDGITRFITPGDPLALVQHLGGPIPVWKLNLENIAQQTTTSKVGPPAQFASTDSQTSLFFTLSSRVVGRPPHHDNADYDEIILYFRGPGDWGGVNQPGTLTWVPKGAMHWGPSEDVPEGYWAWLLECADTMRLTDDGKAAAAYMETGNYTQLTPG